MNINVHAKFNGNLSDGMIFPWEPYEPHGSKKSGEKFILWENVWIICHGNSSNLCWDVSVWTNVVGWPQESPTLPSLEPCHMAKYGSTDSFTYLFLFLCLTILDDYITGWNYRGQHWQKLQHSSRVLSSFPVTPPPRCSFQIRNMFSSLADGIQFQFRENFSFSGHLISRDQSQKKLTFFSSASLFFVTPLSRIMWYPYFGHSASLSRWLQV